ncbi:Bdr family repetitive protein [Borrelia hispanica]|uniref:Bdr family repetitive protein n=1 Tax=Borrelia hispanica TaxID=40835 RepID=UPI0004661E64|nr:Bdr family repetitive protein [Borrelia hispanica]
MEHMIQPVVTRQMVLNELVKVGMDRDIADDLSYRYYKNELTTKDLELLKMAFKSDIRDLNNKIDTVENNLNNKIDTKFNELDNKIDTKFNELDNKIDIIENNLKSDIRDLNNKIDTVENNLNIKIDTVENNLKSEISFVRKDMDLIRKDMDMNKTELNSKLKLNNWMLGTIITINVGILLTLISIINSIINK